MQITWSVFPEFHRHLDPQALAALVQEIGADTVQIVVRDGYWVRPETLAGDCERFVKAMRKEGIEVPFASTTYMPDQLVADPTPLRVLADNGVRGFQLGYFEVPHDVRGEMRRARSDLQRLVPVLEKHRIRAIYPLHHATLVSSPSGAYGLVDGLPPESIAIQLDPGSQTFEGHEHYERSMRLLGRYVGWCAINDTALRHDPAGASGADKGWRREWAPVYEGVVRWDEFFGALGAIDFHGVVQLVPRYDADQPDQQRAKMKREIEYLKRVADQAERERVKRL
jgi:sugar phosphate isomerase/epimerase